jgi:hypothetical protein
MKNTSLALFSMLCAMLAAGPLASGQTTVPVQVLQNIDSSKAVNGARFSGKFVSAVTTPQGGTVAAGTVASLALTETSVAGVSTWTLSLVSPVTGSAVSVGAAAANAASKVGKQLGALGIPGPAGRKAQAAPVAARPVSTGGTSVYVPANTQVSFALTQPAPNPAATAAPVAAPTVAPVAAAPASRGPAVAPVAATTGIPAATAGSPAASGAGRAGAPAATGSSTVVWGNVQYVLQSCQRQAPHITCSVQVTNLAGGDVALSTNRNTYFIDQSGNRVQLSAASVANCNLIGRCLALSGLPMSATYVFLDQDSKSTQLVRLLLVTQAGGSVQFSNVTVQ